MSETKPLMPWVVASPAGVHWLGHARDEAAAWTYALGWPDQQDIEHYKSIGWYAAPATVNWTHPQSQEKQHEPPPPDH